MSTPSQASEYRFMDWEIDPVARTLRVRGAPVKIGSRAFDVLLALVHAPGQVLTKAALLDAAWPGLVVEENNLSVQVTTLRKLLGPDVVLNVPGIGYRLGVAPLPAPAAPAAVAAPPTQAPVLAAQDAADGLIGREVDLQTLLPWIGHHPLVTLVGTGGIGKTTLARAAVARLGGERFPDGVHWIDLAPLRADDALPQLLAQALEIVTSDESGADELPRALSQMQALVVLDNCEHVLDALVPVVAQVLARQGRVRWLATSQQPLHLAGETVFRLTPLQLPAPDATPDDALRAPAVALLLQRVRALDRCFTLAPAQGPRLADLCRQLDGLPLALEMAAARVATLGLDAVHTQIDQRLRLKTSRRTAPGRHHTLQQTFEWSYGLLSPVEQAVFRRLEPCAGGFTLETAQALCCQPADGLQQLDPWDATEALHALVDRSLVQHGPLEGSTAPRLHLLESARDFARVQLLAQGEWQAVHQQHALVVASAVQDAHDSLLTSADRDWTARHLPERRNVRSALRWACAHGDPDTLATLTSALALMDACTFTPCEVLQVGVPSDRLQDASPPLRARARLDLSWAHFLDGHRELGTTLAEAALQDFDRLADPVGTYHALLRLARLYAGRPGMTTQARACWERLRTLGHGTVPLRLRILWHSTVEVLFGADRSVEALRDWQRSAERAGLEAQAAVCRLKITDELLLAGRHAEAAQAARDMLAAGERLPRVRAIMQLNLAQALARLGQMDAAQAAARQALRTLPGSAFLVLDLLAHTVAGQGRLEEAALLAGCSERVRRERALAAEASEVDLIRATQTWLEAGLGPERAAALRAQAAALSVDEVLALAWQPEADASGAREP